RQRHATLPLSILNYTEKAQWDRVWNPVTLTCRGLILDDDNEVVARPFGKFFNLADHEQDDPRLGWPCDVYEKLDGSLGIAYRYGDHVGIATRGSFDSEQAQWATRFWH